MVFASPIWLLGLLPWAAVVVYLLPGKGTPASVPFIELWRGTAVMPRRTGRKFPSLAMLLSLLALLLCILAAAGPGYFSRGVMGGDVSIVLDRGASMSLPSASGQRFRNVISRVGPIAGNAMVTLVPVPGRAITTTGQAWVGVAESMPPTAIPTQLDQVIANQLRLSTGPVFVLSDQTLNLNDPRIVQIKPEKPEGFVAITAMGARLSPTPQVMVRLENHSDLPATTVSIRSGDVRTTRQISLPANGKSADQFFDLSTLGQTVIAQIDGENHAWSRGYLVRESNGIQIAVDVSVDDSVRRVAEIYGKDRPVAANAKSVLISDQAIQNDQNGIWIAAISNGGKTGPTVVVPNDLTRNISSWPKAGAAAMPANFTPVVRVDGKVIVAQCEDVTRRVWINADMTEWEKTADFVVFFANALDWIAGKDQVYASVAPGMLGDDWHAVDSSLPGAKPGEWPGIYQSAVGGLAAVNAGSVPVMPAFPMTSGTARSLEVRTSVAGSMIFGALVCLLVAVLVWPGVRGGGGYFGSTSR